MMYTALSMGKKRQIPQEKLIAYDMAYLMKWILVINVSILLSFVACSNMCPIPKVICAKRFRF